MRLRQRRPQSQSHRRHYRPPQKPGSASPAKRAHTQRPIQGPAAPHSSPAFSVQPGIARTRGPLAPTIPRFLPLLAETRRFELLDRLHSQHLSRVPLSATQARLRGLAQSKACLRPQQTRLSPRAVRRAVASGFPYCRQAWQGLSPTRQGADMLGRRRRIGWRHEHCTETGCR